MNKHRQKESTTFSQKRPRSGIIETDFRVRQDGFVEAHPSRVLWDGWGSFDFERVTTTDWILLQIGTKGFRIRKSAFCAEKEVIH